MSGFTNHPDQDFGVRIHDALGDAELRESFHGAMTFLRDRRRAQFPDPEALETLRDSGAAIRDRALAQLPDLLEQLEDRCRHNGIQVHWAETAEDANRIITGLIRAVNGKRIVKGKSMATEEIGLNTALEAAGFTCLESDMGEYIVQQAHETPSHIIMPAIHRNKASIARQFAEQIPDTPYTEDVDELIGTGRRVLRRAFAEADVGISGVNFAVAETGTLCLVENEGNGRMSTTVPDTHIAVMGLEKVIEKLADLPDLMRLLPKSATGQAITTYVNMISGPRRDDESDGPRQVHLVLLDNGRSRIYADRQLRATLRCIRCGACMNHCPVYERLGGHAYGTVYPGPIGQVVMPQLFGLDHAGKLTQACSLNGACGEVCPVRIPLPDLIRRLRHEGVSTDPASPVRGHGRQRRFSEALIWRVWCFIHTRPPLYRLVTRVATRARHWLPPLPRAWTRHRAPLQPADRSFQEMMRHREDRRS
ncbi:iron-sulfur cluster-binding protein [Marinobacter halodurans]|uniref:Iron-sulfur cluster-binding protein n=1 Tax=Marinobacter halodurans TaxID=2528979 RepID=A0ABY1ZHY5_9GAMM|nr:LutB/LldF family L-lactate oxidation iron-sulfur protein [Marinobacter halodurans]TBW52892.1 iron-sulfur cluster-binding protein [Marinobacter halodurans]